ncbi:hypothetical protein R50073_49010 (plasmid) [Maricurvus nonylphenolicus]|jgi:hypothetical protein|uniref:hypothetical protein n=1 Tax=Maricurvus nonylphenolicus TaxID=1008307 RepID=UPI0036F3689D
MHKMIVPILVSLFLIACASNEGYDRVAAEKQKQKVIDAKNDRLKEVIEDLPDWAVNPPKSDQEGMYAVGMGNSDSFNTALKMATLEAEFGLAKLYSQELSGSERIYATGGEFEGVTSYQGLIDKIVDSVPVVGYQTEKKEIKAIQGNYQAFVLLKLPYDQFNEVLKQQRSKATDVAMKEAFDELEQRLEKRKSQQ